METLHRLAGMTETSSPHDPPSQPTAIPQESDDAQNDSNRASRVSLPLNRRASHKSFRSGRSASRDAKRTPIPGEGDAPPLPSQPGSHNIRQSTDTGVSGSEEDFRWGPNHPCFPHPNPHCAPDSEEAHTTRVIRVRRDWLQAGDLYPQYANLYPEILDPLVSDEDFRFLISNINARLRETFDPYSTRAAIDAVVGAATGYIWDTLGMTGAKRGMRALETFVEKWNAEKARQEKEVRLVQLRRTGFMSMDFVIPDPHIDVVEEGMEDEEEGGIGPALE
jgi:hypothetical protein